MKKIILVSYILGVLLFSGFARAESTTTPLAIGHVQYQEGSWQIEISGPLKNFCLSSPHPTLVPSNTQPNTLILKVVATETGDLCAQAIKGSFNLSTDLRLLMQRSGVLVAPHQIYTVKTEGYPFEVSFSGGDVMTISPMGMGQAVQVSGILMTTAQGQVAIITEQNKIVLVDDSQISSAPFMNKKVSLVGRYGPLQSNDERIVNPSRNQNILPVVPTQRLLVERIDQVL